MSDEPAILLAGWYIITYGLGIYVLNLLIGFLSPQADPESEGPMLPTSKVPCSVQAWLRRPLWAVPRVCHGQPDAALDAQRPAGYWGRPVCRCLSLLWTDAR